jgi:hypothetical protein
MVPPGASVMSLRTRGGNWGEVMRSRSLQPLRRLSPSIGPRLCYCCFHTSSVRAASAASPGRGRAGSWSRRWQATHCDSLPVLPVRVWPMGPGCSELPACSSQLVEQFGSSCPSPCCPAVPRPPPLNSCKLRTNYCPTKLIFKLNQLNSTESQLDSQVGDLT